MNLDDERWPAMEPPLDFADRVATRWSRRRSRTIALTVAVCSMAAALLLVVWLRFDRGERGGDLVAASRTTVEIGDRAIAVAEADTVLSWSRESTGWRVRQDRGSAFYRVDQGDSFVVETPEGTIAVTGTCFAVEVHTMNPTTRRLLAPIGVTAALSAITVVTLYEGGVVLANDDGESIALKPGERAALVDGRAPAALDDGALADSGAKPVDGQSRVALGAQQREIEALRERVETGRKEIEALEAELRELEAPIGSPAWIRECANSSGGYRGCSDLEPSQEVLEEMARCGTVKADIPAFLYTPDGIPSEEWLEATGVQEDEAEIVRSAAKDFFVEYREGWLDIAAAAGLPLEAAREMPWGALQAWVQTEVADERWPAYQLAVARERAGLAQSSDPAGRDPQERTLRQFVEAGERFEQHLGRALGPERARELRRSDDGWQGGDHLMGGSACQDE